MTINLTAGKVKEAMQGVASRDLWQVPLDQLYAIPGFNVRTDNAEYQAHINEIADSIAANGFYQAKPLSGFVALIDGVQRICVTDGYSRWEGTKLAVARGHELATLPVVVTPKGTSMEDLTVGLVTLNRGKPLSQYETGLVCKRLIGYGWDEKQIAQRLSMTVGRVNDLLSLVAAPVAVRTLVANGTVSASQAIKTIKQHGAEAPAKLQAGVEKAASAGKTKATKKDIENKPTHAAVVKALLAWDDSGAKQDRLSKIIDMARASL